MGLSLLVEAHHLLQGDEEYYMGIKSYPHTWILDNSTALGEDISPEKYMKIVKDLNPTFAIAPDVLNNYSETVSRCSYFMESLEDAYTGSKLFMVVPQGRNMSEWLMCAERMREFPHALIGIPYRFQGMFYVDRKDTATARMTDRVMLVTYLHKIWPKEKFHLLGIWHPLELFVGRDYNVVSGDSSLCFRCALSDDSIFAGNRPVKVPKLTFEEEVDIEEWMAHVIEFENFVRIDIPTLRR
jgi:hypothetical protein